MQSAVTIQDAKLLISRFWRDLQGVAGRKEEAYVQSLSEWMEVADTKAVELRAASKASRPRHRPQRHSFQQHESAASS